MSTLEPILREHPFLKGMKPEHLNVLAGCATNVRFEAGDFLQKEGDEANHWYLMRSGHVVLEVDVPGRGPVQVGSLGEEDVIGWSWLVAPYVWHFDARAVTVTRVIALDGKCLRTKCENDHELGYELMKRFLYVVQQRLFWSRVQLLDIYKTRS
jgi:CRP-like cAMP-binding protein